MLEVEILKKSFKESKILSNIKFTAKKSEIISIIGPSGCGKSTLLRIVSSLDLDYKGSVLYEGKGIIENLGYIFQDPRLLPWLSVKDNVLLVMKNKDENKVENLLCEVGLKDYINSYTKELSGGMKRRVSIVRAFINSPKVLLLDEPFISLDFPTAQALRKLLFKFFKEYSPTVLLVTHDLSEALSLSNRILFLDSKPASIIYEYENIISFDLDVNEVKKQNILKEFPSILSGEI